MIDGPVLAHGCGMLISLLFLAAVAAPLTANNYAIDEPLAAPRLLWSDEFNGTALDRTKWNYETSRNKAGWHNGELQYYSADRRENLRVEGGRLIIEARRDPVAIRGKADWGGQQYSSARISTAGLAAFRYGFIEVRAKVTCGRGTWPAIWMMPAGQHRWPEGGEIDILEYVGSIPGKVHATLHSGLFNHERGTQRGAEKSLADACNEFHNYQLSWRADAITIGVDGRAYMRVRNDQPGGRGAWPFDTQFYFILNLAIGGNWAGAKGIEDAAMPQRFEVDYVRVWQIPE